jgi:hypothetical protein
LQGFTAVKISKGVWHREIEKRNGVKLGHLYPDPTPRWFNEKKRKENGINLYGEPDRGCARRCWLGFSRGLLSEEVSNSSRDAHPSGGNGVVIITILVVPGQAVGIALARREHDARPRGDILTELAAATHVHFKNDHTKEIAVLAGFTLT